MLIRGVCALCSAHPLGQTVHTLRASSLLKQVLLDHVEIGASKCSCTMRCITLSTYDKVKSGILTVYIFILPKENLPTSVKVLIVTDLTNFSYKSHNHRYTGVGRLTKVGWVKERTYSSIFCIASQ